MIGPKDTRHLIHRCVATVMSAPPTPPAMASPRHPLPLRGRLWRADDIRPYGGVEVCGRGRRPRRPVMPPSPRGTEMRRRSISGGSDKGTTTPPSRLCRGTLSPSVTPLAMALPLLHTSKAYVGRLWSVQGRRRVQGHLIHQSVFPLPLKGKATLSVFACGESTSPRGERRRADSPAVHRRRTAAFCLYVPIVG